MKTTDNLITDERFSVLNLEVKTQSSTHQINLGDDLLIAPEHLNDAFIEQPAKFAYWATVAIQAKSLVDKKKLEVDKQEDFLKKNLIGELDGEARKELELNGEKITEAKVANGIYTNERYQDEQAKYYQLKEELLELQNQFAILDMAKEAMNQRKDMLISLGAQLRMEGNNAELTIKSEYAKKIMRANKRTPIKSK